MCHRRRSIAAALALTLAGGALADEPVAAAVPPAGPPSDVAARSTPQDDPGLVGPLRTGERGLVLFTDGTAVEGRVVSLTERSAAIRVDSVRRTRRTPPAQILQRQLSEIRGFVSLAGSPRTSGDEATEVRVVLADGGVVGGVLVGRDAGGIAMDGPGGRREIPVAHMRQIHEMGNRGRPMATRQRHLEVASAVLPAPGNLRLAVLRGAHLVGTHGVSRRIALEAGSAVPVLHASSTPANVDAALRAAYEVSPWLAVSAGLHLEAARPGRYAGRLSASVTAGSPHLQATLYGGPTFAGGEELADLGELSGALAITARLSTRLEAVGEAWVSSMDGRSDQLALLALRYRFDALAVDLGATAAGRSREVGPWFGLSLDLSR